MSRSFSFILIMYVFLKKYFSMLHFTFVFLMQLFYFVFVLCYSLLHCSPCFPSFFLVFFVSNLPSSIAQSRTNGGSDDTVQQGPVRRRSSIVRADRDAGLIPNEAMKLAVKEVSI